MAETKRRLPPLDYALVWFTLIIFAASLFGMSIGLVFSTLFWAYVVGTLAVLVLFFALLAYYMRNRQARMRIVEASPEKARESRPRVPT